MAITVGHSSTASDSLGATLWGTAATAEHDAAPGLLSYQALQALSQQRVGLICYSALLNRLTYDEDEDNSGVVYARATSLHRQLFPDAGALEGADEWDAEMEFLSEVHESLFPLDDYTDELFYAAGEHPLLYPIWPLCYGIPWDVIWLDELSLNAACYPLLAVVVPGLVPTEYGVENIAFDNQDNAETWQREHGVTVSAPENFMMMNYVLARLRALPAPLNALATLYRCLLRNSGNPFLDNSTYNEDFPDQLLPWEPWAVQELVVQYAQVRADLDALNHYYGWFAQTPDAREQVLTALAAAFEEVDYDPTTIECV